MLGLLHADSYACVMFPNFPLLIKGNPIDITGNIFLDYVFTHLEPVSPLSPALILAALFQFHMELPHLEMTFQITLDKNFLAPCKEFLSYHHSVFD